MRSIVVLSLLAACGTPQDAEVDGPPPTWNGDVMRLMEEHCTSCHTDGGVAPMALDTYEAVHEASPSSGAPVYDTLVPYIEAGIMPPYGSMSECIETPNDHSYEIDADELDIIVRWLEADRPLGDGPEIHFEPPPSPADALGAADFTARRAEPYQPQFGGDGSEYACFVIDPEHTEPKWIEAITPNIDNERVVHHMLLFRSDSLSGSTCSTAVMMDSDLIAGWAPGQDGWFLPEDVAFKLDVGEKLALQIHYDASNDNGQKDRSGLDLHYTEDAIHEAGVLWTGSVFAGPDEPSGNFGEWYVPAGEANQEVSGSCTINDAMGEISIFGAWPHMHLLGKHMDATAVRGGVHECLVDVNFSFDDQRGYQYTEPMTLKPGDRIDTVCTFDNSADNPNNPYDPPRDIHLGEETDDEMCLNFLMYWPASDVQYCLF